jgi:hypothetical protein
VTAAVRVTATISDEEVRQVLLALHPGGRRPRGDGWARCQEQRAAIERSLADGLRLTKIRNLLGRHGVEIALNVRLTAMAAGKNAGRIWIVQYPSVRSRPGSSSTISVTAAASAIQQTFLCPTSTKTVASRQQ